MKTLDLDIVLFNLAGEPIKDGDKDFTMGKALGNMVINSKTGGKMKLYDLGVKFYAGGKIELDAADFSLVLNAVKTTDGGALISGQAEKYLEGLK